MMSRAMRVQIGLVILLVLSMMGCSANDASRNIAISVAPSKAFIVPGSGSSCVSLAAAKVDSTVPELDVQGERVVFSRFALQWRSDDKLTIAEIKATVFSDGIDGADGEDGLEIPVDEDEVAAMLGLSTLTIPFEFPYPKPNGPRVATLDSTDSSKAKQYAPCGFQLGGMTSVKGVKTYSARIKIEISGYKTACNRQDDGSCKDDIQTPVRQSVTVNAERY